MRRGFRRIPDTRVWLNRTLYTFLAMCQPRAVVHQTYYGDNTYLGSRPLVVTVYDLIHHLYRGQFSMRDDACDPAVKYQRVNCARADHIIAISETTKADLVRHYDIDPAKVTVIHLGNSLPARQEPAAGNLPPTDRVLLGGDEYLLYVGQRSGYKNFGALLEAFGRSPLLRQRFKLLCFGGGGFSAAERERIAALGVGERIIQRHGDDRALARCYHDATAFVYPSLYEGFGLPLLEAMGQHCPIFCSTGGSLPEVAGDAAVYFDPENVASLQAALEETLADPARTALLVACGDERIKRFSWEKCARETLEVYQRLMA